MPKLRVRSISAANCRRLWPLQSVAVVAELADKHLHKCIIESKRDSSLLTLFPVTLSTVLFCAWFPCSLVSFFYLYQRRCEMKNKNPAITVSWPVLDHRCRYRNGMSIIGGRKWRKKVDKISCGASIDHFWGRRLRPWRKPKLLLM